MDNSDRLCALAAQALGAWGLAARHVSLVSHSENLVFRAETEQGVYALRFHRPGYHSLEALQSEVVLHELVRSAGLETPAAVPTLAGGYYTQVEMPDSGEIRYTGLTRWIDGTVLETLIATSDDAAARYACYRQLGRLMATLHAQAPGWELPDGFVRHALDADGLAGPTPFWGRFWDAAAATRAQKLVLSAARQQLHERLSRLNRGSEYFGIIHADLHPANIMVDGARIVIFDFDDAAFGWFLYDIATALFDAWLDDDDFANTHAALLEGYRERRPFTAEMQALLPTFLLARMLAYVGWLDARPENAHHDTLPGLIAQSCERVRDLCA